MTVEEIQQAIAKLSPEERAQLQAWLAQFAAAPSKPTAERTAQKLGRLAGRVAAEVRNRLREP